MLAMLSLIEIPAYIQAVYSEYKDLAQKIYAFTKHSGKSEKILGHKDLFKRVKKESFIYIANGVFRHVIEGNMVRFYSEFDFVLSRRNSDPNSTLISDFTSEITVFDRSVFLQTIASDNYIMEKWATLMDLENRINLFLASAYMQQIVVPDFTLRGYDEGDVIIKDGDESRDIFDMVSGSAEVFKKNKSLGIINEGEVFGEVSFFTGSRRTATVRALRKCLVRIIHEDNFADMIRHNPNFIVSIAKTLARRIVHLNQRLTGKSERVKMKPK